MYEPNRFLVKAVESGNAYTVRGAITGIIHANPRNQNNEVGNAIKYAEECGISVFEANDNPSFEMTLDETKWDSGYFASSMTALQNNFTRERLSHVLAVSKKTHPVSVNSSVNVKTPASTINVHKDPLHNTTVNRSSFSMPKKTVSHWKTALIAVAGIALVALVIVLLVSNGNRK